MSAKFIGEAKQLWSLQFLFIDVASSSVVCTRTVATDIFFHALLIPCCGLRLTSVAYLQGKFLLHVNSPRIWSKAVRILVVAVASCPHWILVSAVASCFDAEAWRAAGAVPPPGGFAICTRHSRPACLKTTLRAEEPKTSLETYKLVVPLNAEFFFWFLYLWYSPSTRIQAGKHES